MCAEQKPKDVLDHEGQLLQPVDRDELEAWEDLNADAFVMIIGMAVDMMIPHISGRLSIS